MVDEKRDVSLLATAFEALYNSGGGSRIVPTLRSCLMAELDGARNVLDLGCGANSPVASVSGIRRVGVEGHFDSARLARSRGTHDEIIEADLRFVEFAPRSFDAVVMIEVLEHLEHKEGERLLDKAMSWSDHKVIVTTPNGYWPQGSLGGNELQVHRSGWTIEELQDFGMRIKGLAGARMLRVENKGVVPRGATEFAATLRGRPWPAALVLAAATQIITYRLPRFAFELFATWER